eukprot:CCRYP_010427-RD/>CCRYP_010427-RD protein AED:0.48 eAED:0.59 QI:0/0/0/1/0/0/2/0/128
MTRSKSSRLLMTRQKALLPYSTGNAFRIESHWPQFPLIPLPKRKHGQLLLRLAIVKFCHFDGLISHLNHSVGKLDIFSTTLSCLVGGGGRLVLDNLLGLLSKIIEPIHHRFHIVGIAEQRYEFAFGGQ